MVPDVVNVVAVRVKILLHNHDVDLCRLPSFPSLVEFSDLLGAGIDVLLHDFYKLTNIFIKT